MKKLFVGHLSADETEENVTAMFSEFGTVRSIKLAFDVFSGKCKGFGFIEMEGHEARAAIDGLHGKMINHKPLIVRFEDKKGGSRQRRR